MPAADEVMLYKAFNSLFNSLFKWKGSIFLPFLNSSLDIVAKKKVLWKTLRNVFLHKFVEYFVWSPAP